MWRKIHSNRNPADTIWSELQKEFGHYGAALGGAFQRGCKKHPKVFWGLMAGVLFLSVLITFRPAPSRPRHIGLGSMIHPVSDGIGQMLSTAQEIRETLVLRHVVDSLARRPTLSRADSVALDTALCRLERINKTN